MSSGHQNASGGWLNKVLMSFFWLMLLSAAAFVFIPDGRLLIPFGIFFFAVSSAFAWGFWTHFYWSLTSSDKKEKREKFAYFWTASVWSIAAVGTATLVLPKLLKGGFPM